MDPLAYFLIVTLLAFIVETLVEYLVGKPFDKFPVLTPHKWSLIYVSGLFGVGLALYFKIDVLPLAGLEPSPVGQILSGLLISRGSNFVNDLWSKFFPHKPK
jgi:hypothetical protein